MGCKGNYVTDVNFITSIYSMNSGLKFISISTGQQKNSYDIIRVSKIWR
jgi:hypothetical protein